MTLEVSEKVTKPKRVSIAALFALVFCAMLEAWTVTLSKSLLTKTDSDMSRRKSTCTAHSSSAEPACDTKRSKSAICLIAMFQKKSTRRNLGLIC
eukprot:m.343534 g.343534  ORF g.343534 m.343534 type:complete len:95 (-) comp22966_c0_seq1:116-400(-)